MENSYGVTKDEGAGSAFAQGSRGLRRRRARSNAIAQKRYLYDEWLARAKHLQDGDRILIEKSLGEGMDSVQLGKVFHVSASCIRRRLRRIKRLLNDPCFLLVAHFGECLPVAMLPVARCYFVEGASLRQCAARYHTTLHQIRQMLSVIRSILILKDSPVNLHMRAIEKTRAVQLSALQLDRPARD